MQDPSYLSFQGLICPNCTARNRLSANYCDNCGRRLQLTCANCGTRNRLGANYCDQCGLRLEAQKDSTAALPGQVAVEDPASFVAPASSVAPASTSVQQPQEKAYPPSGQSPGLLRHIPQEFAVKLETARSEKAMLGERRIVTFLFCDMAGSTTMAGEMDPEEWAEIINEIFEIMIQPVYAYEGIVARLMGDAILAFFGAPIAHEDDPQRAVLAGLEIVRKMQAYRESRPTRVGLNLRVGINTGLVMVGQVGSDLQMEYTALGDAINIAARMEQTAQPGTVQVAEDTYRVVAPLFEFEDLGFVEIKGKPGPVRTYRPLGLKEQPGKLRGIEGLNAPLVGRDVEYNTLVSAIQELRRGVGKIIFLVGEAGLGKSRLIREAREYSTTSGTPSLAGSGFGSRRGRGQGVGEVESAIAWYEAASLSYETVTPYGLFQHLFRSLWGITANDSTVAVRNKIASALDRYPLDDRPQAQAILEGLLGKQSDLQALSLEGEGFKRRLFEIVQDLCRFETSQAPTVLVLDDLHWSDPASIELLLHLVKLTDQAPLLVICATRFDPASPAWEARQALGTRYPHRFVEINLRPLTSSESQALVDELLTIADLPEALRRRILEKTEGNPFFIEEVIRVLIDRGVIIPEIDASGRNGGVRWRAVSPIGDTTFGNARDNLSDIEIPENLLTLLIARIDRLDEQARRTLQMASVIGRSFYYRILQAIILQTLNQPNLPVQDELDRELLALQQAELIREARRIPELEYMFRHSLTQEAAYETILLKQRREFHYRVGEAIEQLFANRLEEFYPVLAHHFAEAGDRRALHYTLLSGDSAFRLYAIPEALAHYDKGLEIARRQGDEVPAATWIHLYTRRGRVFELQTRYPEALRNYEEMYALANRREDPVMQLDALMAHATALAVPTPAQDADKAKDLSEQALALARQLGDGRAEARILWNFLLIHVYSGRTRESIPYGEQAVALARQYDLPEQLAHALQDLALSYMATGEFDGARQALDEARSIWKELGNLPMLAENLANSVFHRTTIGEFQESLSFAEESLATSRKIGNEWGEVNSRIFVGLVYQAMGEYDRALENLRVVIPLSRKTGHPASTICQVQLAWCYLSLGALEKAFEVARQAQADTNIFQPFRALLLSCLAKLALHSGDLVEADRRIQESAQVGYEKTLYIFDLDRQLTHVDVLLAQKAYSEAAGQIEDLLDRVRTSGALYFLPEALFQQARLLAAQGQPTTAYETLQEARSAASGLGARQPLWRILAALAQLASMLGDQEEAGAYEQEARQMARFFLDHIAEPELQESFQRLSEAVLEQTEEPGFIHPDYFIGG